MPRQVLSLAWFSATIWATIQYEHGSFRKRFLYQIWGAYSAYLSILPVTVIVSGRLPPWVREKVVEYVKELSNTACFCMFIFLLWPTNAGTYFRKMEMSDADECAVLAEQRSPTRALSSWERSTSTFDTL